jgi:uncharacterized protein YjbJ (UPF0337 family)
MRRAELNHFFLFPSKWKQASSRPPPRRTWLAEPEPTVDLPGCTSLATLEASIMGGKIDKIKGSVKEFVGKVTGNTRIEAEGKTDKAKGHVKEAGEKITETAKGVRDSLKK